MILFEPSKPVTERVRSVLRDAPEHERAPWLAVADEGCSYAIVVQGDGAFTIPTGRPVILRIGDDMLTAKGPAAFHLPSLRRFLPRISAAVIVSSEATLEAYSAAAAGAAVERWDVVLIETQPEQEEAWLGLVDEMAPRARILLSRPFPRERAH